MAERDSQYTLAGIVELGDTFFGAPRKGGKRGRGTTKAKAIVALSINEVGSLQFAKMQVVPDLKGTTIGKFAKENIVAGSEVFTDAYLAYRKPLSVKYWHNYAVFDADSDMLRWLHTIIGNSKSFVLENDVLHADETTLQVLHEEGKTPQSKSYMWLYRTSGDTKQAIVLY